MRNVAWGHIGHTERSRDDNCLLRLPHHHASLETVYAAARVAYHAGTTSPRMDLARDALNAADAIASATARTWLPRQALAATNAATHAAVTAAKPPGLRRGILSFLLG